MENFKQENPQSRLKILQTVEKKIVATGIDRNLMNQSFPFNGKILLGFVILNLGLISMFVYVFNCAQTLAEYAQSIYMSSIGVLVFTALIIILLNVKKLFNLIDSCEDLVNTCKFKKIAFR